MQHALISISILITLVTVVIGATWKLLGSIQAVKERVSDLEKSVLRGMLTERDRTCKLVNHRISEHQHGCVAMQQYLPER